MPSRYNRQYSGKKRKRYESYSDEESSSSSVEYSDEDCSNSYDEDDESPYFSNSYDDNSSSEDSESSDDGRYYKKQNFNNWPQKNSYVNFRSNNNFRRDYIPQYSNNFFNKKFNYYKRYDNFQNYSFENSGRYRRNNYNNVTRNQSASALSGKQYTSSNIIRRHINNILSNNSTIELSQLVIANKSLDRLVNNIETKKHLTRIVIEELELDNEKSWMTLIQSFANHPELVHIEIVDCGLLPSAIAVLANIADKLPNVTSLILDHNKIGSLGLMFLENFYEKGKQKLEVLRIADNDLDSSGIKIYLKNILRKSNGLRTLDISENENLGAISLYELLTAFEQKNCHLKHLILNNTGIKLEGASELAKIIKENETLEEIELRYNKIEDQGMLLIFKALEFNTSLNYLDISYNHLTERGTEKCLEILERIKLNKSTFPNVVLYQNPNAKSENKISEKMNNKYIAIYNDYEESYYKRVKKNSITKDKTYLFYDLETTGTNPCFDQIIQFAAIKTDENFQKQEEYNFYIYLNPDNVPNPIALYGNNIPISRLSRDGDASADQKQNIYPEFEAVHKIFEILNSATVIAGFNTLNFDNQFLQFGFYRNFIPPYELENKAIQLDLFPMVTLYKMLNIPKLNYPADQSLRLEDLQRENSLSSGKAHDALVDVKTTLNLASFMSGDKDLWELLSKQFYPEEVFQKIESTKTHQDGYLLYGNDLRPVFLLLGPSSQSSKRKTAKFFFILLDEFELESADEHAITSITVCKKLIDKKFILTASCDALILDRLKLDLDKELVEKNKAWLNNEANRERLEKIRQLVNKPFPSTIWDLDADLYDNNNNIDSEKAEISMLFNLEALVLRQTNICRKRDFLLEVLQNDIIDRRYRLYNRIIRLLARNYPKRLEPKHFEEFCFFRNDLFCYNRQLTNFKQQSKTTPLEAIKTIKQIKKLLRPKQHQIDLLEELNNYIEQTFPLPLTGHKKRAIYTYDDNKSGPIHLKLVHLDTNTEAGFMMLKVSRRELVNVLLAAKNDEAKRKVIKDEFQDALDKGYLKKPLENITDEYLTSVEGYEYYLKAYLTSTMPLGYKTAGLYASQKGINLELYAVKKGKLCLDKRIAIKASAKADDLNKVASTDLIDEIVRLFIKTNKYFEYQLMQKIDKLPNAISDQANSTVAKPKKPHLLRPSTKRQKTNHVPQNEPVRISEDVDTALLTTNSESIFFSNTNVAKSIPLSSIPVYSEPRGTRRPKKITHNSMEKPIFLNKIPAFDYVEVPGDGHCLFHAVGLYIGKDQQNLRNEVAVHIEQHLAEFRDFIEPAQNQTVEQYLIDVRQGKEWAGNVEIEVLMRVLDQPIIIVHSDRGITNLERVQEFKGEPIFVYYNNHNHYNALLVNNRFNLDDALTQLEELKALRNQAQFTMF